MKKCIIAILLSTVFCTACGSGAEEIAASESVAPAFLATSYVVKESEEKIEAGTAEKETIEAESAEKESVAESKEGIVVDSNFDISTCEDAPVLSGDSRELDWAMIFDENCVVIGEDKYPAYMKISDFSSNITLETVNVGRVSEDNPNELNDYYTIYYHGYRVGGIITSRKADIEPEDAYIYAWTFGGNNDMPKEKVGILGISMTQSASEVAEVYVADELDGSTVNYYGVTELGDDKFACTLKHDAEFMTMLTIMSDETMPGIYDFYSTK